VPRSAQGPNPSATDPFRALGLTAALCRALDEEGYRHPTPVQREVIPPALERRDVLAQAQTGTGKTAAFVLPILQLLSAERPPSTPVRCLILAPTRELAIQIGESIAGYGRHLKIRHAVIYGGVKQRRQEVAIAQRPEILVATPGRLLDLMQQRIVHLGAVEHFVLDEADRMLDMGFVRDVKRIASKIPEGTHTLLLSATLPRTVEALAADMLTRPARVSVEPQVTSAQTVEQSVIFVKRLEKRAVLERLLAQTDVSRALVFTRTKRAANRLSQQLERAGIRSAAIHGNKSQGARERALAEFRSGDSRVLVATDVAARGLDVDGISHVFNYDLPAEPESYVHRIGRTGRAGARGLAVSFCDETERPLLAAIERLLQKRLVVATSDGVRDTSSHRDASNGSRGVHANGNGAREANGNGVRGNGVRDGRSAANRDTRANVLGARANPANGSRDARNGANGSRDARNGANGNRDARNGANGNRDARNGANGSGAARVNGYRDGNRDARTTGSGARATGNRDALANGQRDSGANRDRDARPPVPRIRPPGKLANRRP
jgi:ATP-dependent RNA helicase RhlE